VGEVPVTILVSGLYVVKGWKKILSSGGKRGKTVDYGVTVVTIQAKGEGAQCSVKGRTIKEGYRHGCEGVSLFEARVGKTGGTCRRGSVTTNQLPPIKGSE